MTREELQCCLRQAAPGGGRWLRGDEGVPGAVPWVDERRTPAAVLVGFVEREPGPTLLLTERALHLRDHAGQVSFPGGRVEPEDATIEGAALREAHEEIGLEPARVEVLGRLEPYDTITGFRIHPVIGWIRPPVEIRPDQLEVADVFELPLAFVLNPANHLRQSYRRGALTRGYYLLPFERRFIWGATAGILINIAGLLRRR